MRRLVVETRAQVEQALFDLAADPRAEDLLLQAPLWVLAARGVRWLPLVSLAAALEAGEPPGKRWHGEICCGTEGGYGLAVLEMLATEADWRRVFRLAVAAPLLPRLKSWAARRMAGGEALVVSCD